MTQDSSNATPARKRFSRARLQEVKDALAIPKLDRGQGPFTAAPVQEMFWLLSQVQQAGSGYVIRIAFEVSGSINISILAQSFEELANRHEVLGARFTIQKGTLFVDPAPVQGRFPLEHVVLPAGRDADAALAAQMQVPMDMQNGPLAQAHLFTRSGREHILLIRLHHAIADDASADIIWHELSLIYAALVADKPVPDLGPVTAFLDVAHHQKTTVKTREDQAYWQDALTGCPPLSSPAGDARPRVFDHTGTTHRFEFGASLLQKIDNFATDNQVTPFAVGLATWVLFLQGQIGQSDFVTAVPVSHRNQRALMQTVGPLLNTLALRFHQSPLLDKAAFVKDIQARFLQANEHAALPINQVIELADPARSAAHHPLFQTMFSWITRKTSKPASLANLSVRPLSVRNTAAQFDLTLDLVADENGLNGAFEYATALFDAGTIAAFAEKFTDILEHLVTATEHDVDIPRRAIARIAIPLSDTRNNVVLVPDRIAAQSTRTPQAIALTDGDLSLSYGALDKRANMLANHLIQQGIKPGARVAICLPKSVDCFTAALATWKVGAAYVPIDPENPAERIAFILRDSQASAVIAPSQSNLTTSLVVVAIGTIPHNSNATAPDIEPKGDHAAYVIYTSGSSGTPKGVEVTHHALTTMTSAWGQALSLGADHVFLQMANFAFDVAVADLCRALCFGGQLVLSRKEHLLDPRPLAGLIRQQAVTSGDFTPALLDALMQEHVEAGDVFDSFRLILCGSDIWSRDDAQKLLGFVPQDCQVLHAYGLTETVVDALIMPLEKGEGATGALPLGTPFVPGSVVQITAPDGQPMTGREAGEIWVGGPCLARGYVNRDDLNASAFVEVDDTRLFRTGDLGRINAAGQVEFLGRIDKQIKIRGYRIEPQEIEHRLRALGAQRAHVIKRDNQLIGYVTGVENPKTLHDALAGQVPDYMNPAVLVGIDALPLTQNGKIDAAALPAPDFTSNHRAADDDITRTLATIWQDMLGCDQIGLDDHFFERGGHSMLAVRMAIAASDALKCAVDGALIFAHPTLEGFAKAITETDHNQPKLQKRVRMATLPATAGQESLWFLAQDPNQNVAYNMPFGLSFIRPIEHDPLIRALQALVDRHESLRIGFANTDGRPQLQISDNVNLSVNRNTITQDQVDDFAGRESSRPFDLSQAPLMRATLADVTDGDDILFITFHHIIADGWSIDLFAQELHALYQAFCANNAAPLAPLTLQFGDYAEWQNNHLDDKKEAAQLEFWNKTLKTAPSLLALPTDFPRPAQQDFTGGRCKVSLDASCTAAIRQMAQRCGTTSFVVMLAAWQYLMARLSGQDDVVTGVPDANRILPETRAILGYFVNTLAIRSTPSDAETPQAFVLAVKSDVAQAQANKDVPFAKVVEHVNPQRSSSHSPIFQAMLAWETAPQPAAQASPALFAELEMPSNNAKFDLLLEVTESDAGIVGSLQFAAALFTAETAGRILSYLENILESFVNAPDAALSQIQLNNPGAPDSDAQAPQAGPVAITDADRILNRFATVARHQPEFSACIYGDQHLSYEALQKSSKAFAGHLIKSGLQPQQPVAVWADRTPDMIIAVLGILQAGGCVVPIDPRHPTERIIGILRDANPLGLFAADLKLPQALGVDPVWLRPIIYDETPEGTSVFPVTNPEDASYILYTSGTSGTPKGVVQTHRMLDNLITWQLDQPGLPARVLQFASLAFDVAFQEIFSALCAGATLVLMPKDTHQDVANLGTFLQAHEVERAFLPAAVLHVLRVPSDQRGPSVRCEIITAGEALKLTDALRDTLAALGSTRICNQYGPSETHVVSQQILDTEHMDDLAPDAPIGTAIANTTLHVLDAGLNPVPVGVAGELHIGGAGVAQSYLNRPELTAERFIDDPFDTTSDARLFKSGDLVRRDSKGVLHFLGRIDDQAKIRGYRVEPGEVETVLRQQHGVKDAVVIVRETPAGQPALVAYCVYSDGVKTLAKALGAILPEYMCPREFVLLDQLPLNTSGKVDRKALPTPAWQADRSFTPPATPTETTLCGIWEKTLGADRIGALDDFFENGGHSLLAARILHLINLEFGSDLGLSVLLSHPVLRDLATQIDQRASEITPQSIRQINTDHANRNKPFALTDIQQAYLVGREKDLSLGGVSAHSYTELRIEHFDIPRFEAALNKVIARHDMLRAIFQDDGTQVTLADVPKYQIAVRRIKETTDTAANAALDAQRAHMSHQVLDAGTWPLFGFEVTALPDGYCHLHISLDALIIDAASTSLLMAELIGFYSDPAFSLPTPGVTFRDYVVADQALRLSDAYTDALAYWMDRFEELPTGPDLPLLCPPDAIETPLFHRQEHCIEKPQWDVIKQNAARHHITASGMLLAAFCRILNRYAQNTGFSLSLPLFNRLPLHPDINAVIGDFSSVLLFQTTCDNHGSFADYARAVQSTLWQDMDHSQVSGIEVMRALGRRFGIQPQGLPVVFNSTLTEMDISAAPRPADTALKATNVHTITQTPQVWLDHTIIEENGAVFFNWDSVDGLFPDGMVEAMFTEYCELLQQLAQSAFWTNARQAVLTNAPEVPKPTLVGSSLTDLVITQAALTPHRDAVISNARTLSYATLMAEAETLAARLQNSGLEPGDRVALLTPAGWEQSVGVLGCLLAGGVYVPIDPEFPTDRIDSLLNRTRAKAIVTSPASPWQQPLSGTIISVLQILPDPEPQKARAVECGDTDLAYVIFTSGSTGEPKGVMIDHGGAVNTVRDINTRIGLEPQDRILGVSALNFDLSVYDIFGPLSVGAALVLPDADARRDPAHWRALIRENGVTIWNAVPALSGLLVEEWKQADGPLPLRCAMMSGDWIPLTLPDALRRAAPQITIWSLGGATEASIWSIGYLIEHVSSDWNSIPYGRALDGQSVHVLDTQLAPRPAHVAGEIYIGGRGLALGYWDDPIRTDAAFITHPATGDRLYRTGDLGRVMPDGHIEFLGRTDSQVKVQGYRIELGGIEKALERHSSLHAAAVRIIGDTMTQKRLAAYAVRADATVTEEDLRDHLAAILPSYEIPSSFTWLEALPLSANGKVDRSKLPLPQEKVAAASFQLRDETEQDIADIVSKTLGQNAINPQANLLALGASSLDIVRISNAVAAAHGFRPPLAQFMRAPTVAELMTLWRNSDTPAARAPKPVPDGSSPAVPEMIEDEAGRTAFKAAEKGLRQLDGPRNLLPRVVQDAPLDRFEANRSTRQFAPTPVSWTHFSDVLSALVQNPVQDRPRFQYSSAGGLYPVQTYVFIKQGHVDGIAAGSYYLHPKEQALISVGTGITLDSDSYDYFVNRPTFETAAFAIFFIADMSAITPIYGSGSHNMVLLETGQMAQHLTNRAGEVGLGLCGIGTLEKDILCDLFDLGPTHQLIYSMLGGTPVGPPPSDDETEEFEI